MEKKILCQARLENSNEIVIFVQTDHVEKDYRVHNLEIGHVEKGISHAVQCCNELPYKIC
jgi:hypothetical protein